MIERNSNIEYFPSLNHGLRCYIAANSTKFVSGFFIAWLHSMLPPQTDSIFSQEAGTSQRYIYTSYKSGCNVWTLHNIRRDHFLSRLV